MASISATTYRSYVFVYFILSQPLIVSIFLHRIASRGHSFTPHFRYISHLFPLSFAIHFVSIVQCFRLFYTFSVWNFHNYSECYFQYRLSFTHMIIIDTNSTVHLLPLPLMINIDSTLSSTATFFGVSLVRCTKTQ